MPLPGMKRYVGRKVSTRLSLTSDVYFPAVCSGVSDVKKATFVFTLHSSPNRLTPPINTKGVRGEELVVTLHGRNSLYIKYLCSIGEE